LWWTADPPRPFQLCPVPISSALRFLVTGLPPVFIYRRFHVYLKEPRIPIESPLWYDRFFWQNPVRVTRPVPPGRLPFFIHLIYFRTGRSSSKFAFCWSSTFRSSPSVSNLSIFCVCFQSCDLRHSFPICRSSALGSNLSIFSDRFQSFDFLRPFPVLRPSPFFLRSQPFGWLVSF